MNESIYMAYNANIPDIIILGDINHNMLSNINNKMKELIKTFNMKQSIAKLANFTAKFIFPNRLYDYT